MSDVQGPQPVGPEVAASDVVPPGLRDQTEPASPVSPRLVIDANVLVVEGLDSIRSTRLFLEGVLGGIRTDVGWQLEARGRTMDDLCIQVNRWLTGRGITAELIGQVDVSVERDAERQRSFQRARDAAQRFRAGTSSFARETFLDLLQSAGWDTEARQLREHQVNAAMHAITAANAANFSVPGAGKTATTLATAAAHFAAETIELVVVVGPLSSFGPWEAETAICMPSWRTQRLVGNARQRRRTIRNAQPATVLLSSYPGAVSDIAALKDLCRNRRVMLVADESHRIKRFNGGLWAPAAMDIARLATVRVILSGTPMPQSGLDLFAQLNVMWPGRELTGPKAQFKSRVDRRFGEVIEQVVPFVSRTSKSELGLPPYSVETTEVELSPPESEIYDLLRNHLRRALEAAEPTEADRLAALRRGRPLRLLQAASNASVLSDGHFVRSSEGASPTLLDRIANFERSGEVPAKFAAAGNIIEEFEPTDKAVVWSNFIRNLDAFARYARDELDVEVFQVDGRVAARATDITSTTETSDDDESREAVIARFLAYHGRAVLVTNPASCSESISLHSSCRNAIYLDRTYDCAQWLQSIDRIHRLGLPPDALVRVHVLTARSDGEPTADDLVAASLGGKEARMAQLLQGAALAPLDDTDEAAEGDLDDLRSLMAYLLGQDR